MLEHNWMGALTIFVVGFGGVYIGLILLMLAVQLMSHITRKLEKK
ncbi:MAG: OadG family protein [Syntrophales bacterium]|nr:OadG family protein [Syntrophales bacterium]